MATVTQNAGIERAPARFRLGRPTAVLVVVAMAAVVASAALVVRSPSAPSSPTAISRIDPIYTEDEPAVLRLVAQGVLPYEVIEAEPFRTKALVAYGGGLQHSSSDHVIGRASRALRAHRLRALY